MTTASMGFLIVTLASAAVGNAKPLTRAEQIVAAAKRATGGAAWDGVDGCIEQGTRSDGAIRYTTRFSLRGYGMRIESDRGGQRRTLGFDGGARWMVGGARVDVRSDAESVREAVTTDYLSINGFFFPDRFPAAVTYLRTATDGGRRFDVLEITPRGGRPLEIWFDHRTHLIGRVVDTQGMPPVRVEASDYRRGPGGLIVAYRLDAFGPDGAALDRGVVTSFACGSIDPAIFAPPAG